MTLQHQFGKNLWVLIAFYKQTKYEEPSEEERTKAIIDPEYNPKSKKITKRTKVKLVIKPKTIISIQEIISKDKRDGVILSIIENNIFIDYHIEGSIEVLTNQWDKWITEFGQ